MHLESSLKARLQTNVTTDVSDIDGIDSVPPRIKSLLANLTSDTNRLTYTESDVHERRPNDTITNG